LVNGTGGSKLKTAHIHHSRSSSIHGVPLSDHLLNLFYWKGGITPMDIRLKIQMNQPRQNELPTFPKGWTAIKPPQKGGTTPSTARDEFEPPKATSNCGTATDWG